MLNGLVLYDRVNELVNIRDNTFYHSMDRIEKSLWLAEQLSRAFRVVYSSLKGRADAEFTIPQVADALEKFYIEHVAPLDLPMNDFLETIVDRNLPGFFEPALVALSAKLNQRQEIKPLGS